MAPSTEGSRLAGPIAEIFRIIASTTLYCGEVGGRRAASGKRLNGPEFEAAASRLSVALARNARKSAKGKASPWRCPPGRHPRDSAAPDSGATPRTTRWRRVSKTGGAPAADFLIGPSPRVRPNKLSASSRSLARDHGPCRRSPPRGRPGESPRSTAGSACVLVDAGLLPHAIGDPSL